VHALREIVGHVEETHSRAGLCRQAKVRPWLPLRTRGEEHAVAAATFDAHELVACALAGGHRATHAQHQSAGSGKPGFVGYAAGFRSAHPVAGHPGQLLQRGVTVGRGSIGGQRLQLRLPLFERGILVVDQCE
jgi:hypothetical protein